jgi:hypothetical protein
MIIKKPASVKGRAYCDEINGGAGFQPVSGGVLLCHAVTHVVPSRLSGLTTEFGMGAVLSYLKTRG